MHGSRPSIFTTTTTTTTGTSLPAVEGGGVGDLHFEAQHETQLCHVTTENHLNRVQSHLRVQQFSGLAWRRGGGGEEEENVCV